MGQHEVKIDQWAKAASLPFDYKHDGINKVELAQVNKEDIENTRLSNCLLFGPSGSGKTTTAKRIFDEYDGDHSFDYLNAMHSDDELSEELYSAVQWDVHTKVKEKM